MNKNSSKPTYSSSNIFFGIVLLCIAFFLDVNTFISIVLGIFGFLIVMEELSKKDGSFKPYESSYGDDYYE